MMGVPYEDHEFFQDVARARMDMTAGPEVPIEAGHRLAVYLTELIDRKDKAADPGDDVTGNLLVNQIRPGNLSVEDAVVMLRQLLQAGHETTAHAITMGLLAILLNRDQLRGDAPRLRGHPRRGGGDAALRRRSAHPVLASGRRRTWRSAVRRCARDKAWSRR